MTYLPSRARQKPSSQSAARRATCAGPAISGKSERDEGVLVDDSAVFRRALADVVIAAGHEIVGQARDDQEGVNKALALHPEIVLMDWKMPVMDGITATRVICERVPNVTVIAVTATDQQELAAAFVEAGAAARIDKKNVTGLRKLFSEIERPAA